MSSFLRRLTIVSLLLSTFMAALEMTVVSTAMPTVIADLGGIHHYSWVFTAYILASTICVPIFGKLADQVGRRPLMLLGIGLFLLGSMASGAAQGMATLIAARAVQGIGAGAMQPMAMTIVGDLYGPADRARIQGLFGAIWGLAGLTGPLLGGLIVRALSWRWVFYVNVPFGLASAVVLVIAFQEEVERRPHSIDWRGALLLGATIVLALLGSSGGVLRWALVAAVATGIAFVRVERRAKEPMLPLSLLRRRVIAVSSAGGALVGGVMIATTTFLPLFVQGVLGGSPTDAGMAIAPMAIGWPIASALGGRLLPRVGYRPLVRLGFSLTLLSALVLAFLLQQEIPPFGPRVTSLILGFGLGFANTTLLVAVQASVGWGERGVATASTLLFRTLGGALSVGALGALLSARLTLAPGVPAEAIDALLGPQHGRGLDPELMAGLARLLHAGLAQIFWLIAAIAAVGLLVGMLFPRLAVPRQGVGAEPTPSPAR